MADPKDIDEVILLLQADLPVLRKDKDGQVGNQKTKYADLAQANEQILTRLNALGTTWVCTPTVLLPDYRFVLQYELKHVASGTAKSGTWPLKGDTPMQQGSAVTYGRRYSLLAVTGVVAEEDDDDGGAASGQNFAQRRASRAAAAPAASTGRPMQRAQRTAAGARPPLPGEDNGKVGADQHRHMRALWSDLGAGAEEHRDFRLRKIAEWIGVDQIDSSADLTREQADVVIERLRERKDQMAGQAAEGGEA